MRNRLDHQCLNDLVYIKYNLALKRRYNEHDNIDSISLQDIDDSNEWLIGRMDDEDSHDHVDAKDDLVFDGDELTWVMLLELVGLRSLDLILEQEQAQAWWQVCNIKGEGHIFKL